MPPPETYPALTLQLGFARYEVYPAERRVRTVLLRCNGAYLHCDGAHCDGTRDESDPQNIREAESQGYGNGPGAVWRSLVEHELLHSIVAEWFFGRQSVVMRTEAGVAFTPLWQRYEEETLCLSLQTYLCTGKKPNPLQVYDDGYNLADLVYCWKRDIEPQLADLWSEVEDGDGAHHGE